nr:hypothetical protein [Tanacetum cinerariifolium]
AKRWREEFEWKISLFEIDLTFGINAFDLDTGTEVMKDKGMDDHVPDEIDGSKCEQLPNHVVNKESNMCQLPPVVMGYGIMDECGFELIDGMNSFCFNHIVVDALSKFRPAAISIARLFRHEDAEGDLEQRLPTNMMAYKTREELKGLQKDDMIKAMEMRTVALQLHLQAMKGFGFYKSL